MKKPIYESVYLFKAFACSKEFLIDDFIEKLTKAKEQYKVDKFTIEKSDEDAPLEVYIETRRIETDEEYEIRIEKMKKQEEKKKQEELRAYLYLKEKFEKELKEVVSNEE